MRSGGSESTNASPDAADRASESGEQDLALSLLGSASGTLDQIDAALRLAPAIKLVATNIQTLEEYSVCAGLPFAYYQGPFVISREKLDMQKMDAGRITLRNVTTYRLIALAYGIHCRAPITGPDDWTPPVIEPATGSDVMTFTPILSVNNASDPNDDKISYEFELYTDSGLSNLLASSGTITEGAGITSWTASESLVENQAYFWRSRAYDGWLYGPWMTAASFRANTVNDPPTAPVASSPADGSMVSVLTPTLVVTNAAGAVNEELSPGDFMVITDQINMMGTNPISGYEGPEDEAARFVDMTHAYDAALSEAAVEAGRKRGLRVGRGVLAAVHGPCYETPAEVRMLRLLGADAVTMSTVPEVIMARRLGIRVVGISLITNRAASLHGKGPSHAEVLETSMSAHEGFVGLIEDIVREAKEEVR